jgi:hypothetical protein
MTSSTCTSKPVGEPRDRLWDRTKLNTYDRQRSSPLAAVSTLIIYFVSPTESSGCLSTTNHTKKSAFKAAPQDLEMVLAR